MTSVWGVSAVAILDSSVNLSLIHISEPTRQTTQTNREGQRKKAGLKTERKREERQNGRKKERKRYRIRKNMLIRLTASGL